VWTRLISSTTLFTLGAFVRQDRFNYYPSANVFADGTGLIPGGSSATLNQQRKLTNAGLRTDVSYVKGIHNIKAGATFQHTFLTENFNFGITDPVFNAVCLDASANPDPSPTPTNPAQCANGANPGFQPILLPFDLTRGGALFAFRGRADIKELAFYLQDAITERQLGLQSGASG